MKQNHINKSFKLTIPQNPEKKVSKKTMDEYEQNCSQLEEEKKSFAIQMKSMKKRQETALMEAEQTRESVSMT